MVPLLAAALATTPVSQVWTLEDAYWAALQTGPQSDPRFRRLFADDFVGWPCGVTYPRRKAELVAPKAPIPWNVALSDKVAVERSRLIIVYYRVMITGLSAQPMVMEITHSWAHQRRGGWQIAGGMCQFLSGGPPAPPEQTPPVSPDPR